MAIRIGDLKPGDFDRAGPSGTVQVIVKVRKAGYVPPAVTIRARIDDLMFTADVEANQIPSIEKNPHVVSITAAKKLHVVE